MALIPTGFPPSAPPLTPEQMQAMFVMVQQSYTYQFGQAAADAAAQQASNVVASLVAPPGAPVADEAPAAAPTVESVWPLGVDASGNPISFAAALETLQTAVATLSATVQELKGTP
jgi:hypothetical protein